MRLRYLRYVMFALGVCLVSLISVGSLVGAPVPPSNVPATFKVTSKAFREGKPIPMTYAQKGKNVSPPLAWKGAPKGTKSYALIVEDPDAPGGTWVHWVAFNIPASRMSLPEGAGKVKSPVRGMVQGMNSGKHNGYDGPAPPSGTHHYYFRLYALNVSKLPGIARGATAAQLRSAMKGHEIGHATLMGTYSARK